MVPTPIDSVCIDSACDAAVPATRWCARWISGLVVTLAVLTGFGAPAAAQRIENGKAVFAALDKVTAQITKLSVPINQTVTFGALKVTPRACYTRDPSEPPKTTGFVEVDETMLEGKEKRLFTGWMFAESPGLNAVEHPVYDVWLTDCADPKTVTTTRGPSARGSTEPGAGTGQDGDPLLRRRRPPR